jgi:hypothetical protein
MSDNGNDPDGGDEMRDSEQRQPEEDDTSMQEVGGSNSISSYFLASFILPLF